MGSKNIVSCKCLSSIVLGVILILGITVPNTKAGVPIVGLQSGPTPFQTLFATGFSGSYNTFGTGTTAGAIGAYGRFVSGGANSDTHGSGSGGGGYGKRK